MVVVLVVMNILRDDYLYSTQFFPKINLIYDLM
jgi:hypothetical protein